LSDATTRPEYIRELFAHNETAWSAQRAHDTQIRNLYYNEHAVDVPDTYNERRVRRIKPEVVRLGQAARIVDTVSAWYPQFSSIGVRWIGQKKKGPTQQDQTETAIRETMELCNNEGQLSACRFNMAMFGRSVELGPIGGNTYWWDFPYKQDGESESQWWERYAEWNRRAPSPFFWQDLPPQTTFPPSYGALKEEVLSSIKTTYAELRRIFSAEELSGIEEAYDEKKMWQECTLCIYSDRKDIVYSVLRDGIAGSRFGRSDKILRTVEHGLDRCAIRIVPGMVNATKEDGKYWKSVLFHVKDLILAIDRRASEAATGSKFSNLPMFKGRFQDLGIDEEGAKSQFESFLEGDIIPLRTQVGDQGQEDIEPLFQPSYGQHTQALLQFLLGWTDRVSGVTESIEGSSGPAGQAAWHRSFVVDLARQHFSSLTDAVTAADMDMADMIVRAALAFGERIPINPRGTRESVIYLDPKDLRDWSPYLKTSFKLRIAQNERADWDGAISFMERSRQSGLPIPPSFFMEKLMGIEQPAQMLEEALMWDLLLSDEAKQFQMKQLLDEADIILGEDEGMGIEEFLTQTQGQLPPEIQQLLAAQVAGPGPNGGGGGGKRTLGETQGGMRAGAPMSTLPTGPKPDGMTR